MDKVLKPEKLDIDSNSEGSDVVFRYWKRTFKDYIQTLEALQTDESPPLNKISILINRLSPQVYNKISEATEYNVALLNLEKLYIKPKNEIYARHLLASSYQSESESLDEYKQTLLQLARDCNFESVTAEQNMDDYVRDSFISGIRSSTIRQRLLENYSLTFNQAFGQARTLEVAQRQADAYRSRMTVASTETKNYSKEESSATKKSDDEECSNYINKKTSRCYFCDGTRHPRSLCPAKESSCAKCKKISHWARACKSQKSGEHAANTSSPETEEKPVSSAVLASICQDTQNINIPSGLKKSTMTIYVNDKKTKCLADSGSTSSFIDYSFAVSLKLLIQPDKETITLASQSKQATTEGKVTVNLIYNDQHYPKTKLSVIKNLCSDVLLGLDILSRHSEVILKFGGSRPVLKICNLAALSVEPPSLFQNLDPKMVPIADKSRKYSQIDQEFISTEISRLLKEGIIEKSGSPWRAQVLIITQTSGKRRMVIDYSRTINRFTLLDAYPLPRIEDLANKILI